MTLRSKEEKNYESNDVCFIKPSDIEKEGISLLSESEFYVSKFAYHNARKLPKGSEGKYANVAFRVCNTLAENGSVKIGVCFQDASLSSINVTESVLTECNEERSLLISITHRFSIS